MSEDDYIKACNSTRVRDALSILRDVMPEGPVQRSLLTQATKALSELGDEIKETIVPLT